MKSKLITAACLALILAGCGDKDDTATTGGTEPGMLDKVMESTSEMASTVKSKAGEMAEDAGEATSEAASAVTEKAGELTEGAGEMASDVVDAAKEKIHDAAQGVADATVTDAEKAAGYEMMEAMEKEAIDQELMDKAGGAVGQ